MMLSLHGAFQQLDYSNPTASEKEAILEFVKGCVFVTLPTGEGKSVCYATLPLMFDGFRRYLQSQLEQEFLGGCIALVVSPLLALKKDQVATFKRK